MKKILSLFLALIMVMSFFNGVAVSAENADAWIFSKTEVSAGEEFTMTLIMPETLVISSMGFTLNFDNKAFEIINIENVPYADMQPSMSGCNNNANIGFSYVDPTYDANTEIVAGTELLNVTFRVKDDAELGNKIFEVIDWTVTGAFDEVTFMPFDITPDIGKRVKNVEIVQDNEWVFSKTQVEPGDEFTMAFKMPETLTVSSLGLIIQFDNRAFEIINIKDAPYTDLQPYVAGCNNNANIGISYCDPTYDPNTTIVVGTDLLNVTFKVKEGATPGDKSFKIYDWNVTGAFNEETFLMDDITPELSTREVVVNVKKQQWAKNAITFDKENAPINRTFKMIFTQPETVLASSLGLNIGFDNEAFEIVEVAEAPYAALQPDIEGCNNAGNVAISWVDPTFDANTTIEEGTILLEVTFFVKEGTPLGVKNFDILDYNISGEFKGGSDIPEDVTPCIGSFTGSIEVVEEPTYTVSGSIRSFGVSSKAVKIELLNGDKIVKTKTITGNDVTYTFDKVKEGDYTVRISKSLHASREYDVSVYGKDVTLNGEIWLYGDVNTDGYVNNIDILQIDRKVVNSSSVLNLEENKEYRYKVANVTAITGTDTAINNLDILQINRKIVNLSSVIDRTA